MKRTVRFIALLMCLLFAFAGCGSASREVRANRIAEKVVANAGNVEILYEELYYLVMNEIRAQKALYGEDVYENAAEREALAAFVAENLCTRSHALLSVGYDYGIYVDKGDIADEVQAEMDDILADTFEDDRDAYIESLSADYLTDHYVRTYIGVENYLATEIILAMLENGELDSTDETADAVIRGENMIRTIQVFLDKSDEANTRALAESIRSGIASGATPEARYRAMREAVGGKYNDDFGDMGNGYYFLRGEMEEAYESAAFALAEYDVSNVVETDEGYYIIMRLPKDETYISEHYQELKEKAYIVQLNRKVEERYAGMTVEMTSFGASLDYLQLRPVVVDGGEHTAIWWIVGGVLAALLLTGLALYLVRQRKGKKTPAGKGGTAKHRK